MEIIILIFELVIAVLLSIRGRKYTWLIIGVAIAELFRYVSDYISPSISNNYWLAIIIIYTIAIITTIILKLLTKYIVGKLMTVACFFLSGEIFIILFSKFDINIVDGHITGLIIFIIFGLIGIFLFRRIPIRILESTRGIDNEKRSSNQLASERQIMIISTLFGGQILVSDGIELLNLLSIHGPYEVTTLSGVFLYAGYGEDIIISPIVWLIVWLIVTGIFLMYQSNIQY